MQVVCEATQSSTDKIQEVAFECLVKIMSLYYEKMEFYMERALFGVRLNVVSMLMSAHSERNEVYRGEGRSTGDRILEHSV
jgi:hypothetical protein